MERSLDAGTGLRRLRPISFSNRGCAPVRFVSVGENQLSVHVPSQPPIRVRVWDVTEED